MIEAGTLRDMRLKAQITVGQNSLMLAWALTAIDQGHRNEAQRLRSQVVPWQATGNG